MVHQRNKAMKEYHKIDTIFKRNMESRHKSLLEGDYALDKYSGSV